MKGEHLLWTAALGIVAIKLMERGPPTSLGEFVGYAVFGAILGLSVGEIYDDFTGRSER